MATCDDNKRHQFLLPESFIVLAVRQAVMAKTVNQVSYWVSLLWDHLSPGVRRAVQELVDAALQEYTDGKFPPEESHSRGCLRDLRDLWWSRRRQAPKPGCQDVSHAPDYLESLEANPAIETPYDWHVFLRPDTDSLLPMVVGANGEVVRITQIGDLVIGSPVEGRACVDAAYCFAAGSWYHSRPGVTDVGVPPVVKAKPEPAKPRQKPATMRAMFDPHTIPGGSRDRFSEDEPE